MAISKLKHWIFCLSTLVVAFTDVQGCINAPVWVFSLEEDLKDIYPGLEGIYVQ